MTLALAECVVRDVLFLRSHDGRDGNVYMRGIDPEHVPAERLRLAKRFGHMVPAGTTPADIERVARGIMPFLRNDQGDAAGGQPREDQPFMTTDYA
jgi:hypothetical protein